MDYEAILTLVTTYYGISKETAEEWLESLERQGKLFSFIDHINELKYD